MLTLSISNIIVFIQGRYECGYGMATMSWVQLFYISEVGEQIEVVLEFFVHEKP